MNFQGRIPRTLTTEEVRTIWMGAVNNLAAYIDHADSTGYCLRHDKPLSECRSDGCYMAGAVYQVPLSPEARNLVHY